MTRPEPSDLALAPGVAPPDAEAVLALVGAHLSSPLGRGELARLRFQRERGECEGQQQRWQQAQVWQQRRGGFSFAGFSDPTPWVQQARASSGGLDGRELLEIAAFLEAMAGLRENLLEEDGDAGGAPGDWPLLTGWAAELPELGELARGLRRALLPSGEVADEASPELARLRRQRARQRQAIEAALAGEMQRLGTGASGALQEELVTVRNDRYVLPVRTEARRRAPGVVHGASGSGQTVFVEPLATIELNNENIRLGEQEREEVIRILRELSRQVAVAAPQLEEAAAICGRLELEAGKASFAAAYGGCGAEFGEEALQLDAARHPLLVATLRGRAGREVVPLSLQLAPERMLILSGPNTGGKTVALKTVAVGVWMAQCGLPVCARRARLPLCDAVWADVGDVQSIQQDLSTFSSHLLHIRGILAAATRHSLVLLDELGTATNPAEGAALAVAIAEFLRERGCWTLISTHHDEMKAWAGRHPGSVANGSVAVDPVTLAPTYRFRMGVPGISAGLDMAARLGMPPAIVEGARARLGSGQRQAAEYLRKLQENLAEAEEKLRGAEAREREVGAREQALAAHDRTWQQKQMAQLRAEMERRFTAFSEAGDRRWEKELDELKSSLTAAQQRKLSAARARQRREADEEWKAESAAGLGAARPAAAAGSAVLARPGDQVRLRTLRAPARVLRRLDDGSYEVAAGMVRMQVAAEDIEAVIPAAAPAPPATTGKSADRLTPAMLEVNLIGLRADEAEDKLDRFLDDALMSGAEQIRIVHGAGFGVLRKLVAERLRAHPQVGAFAHPPQNQGGAGVTVAELK
jgi:DNA mismatch repair protein MutS2